MRSEEKLRQSYEKQLEVFVTAKNKKLENLRQRQQQMKDKVEKLTVELEKVEQQITQEEARTFQSFRDFQENAEQQSNKSRQA